MAEVNRREIYRYLGIKGQQEPDLQTKDLVEDCLEELERSVNCRELLQTISADAAARFRT